MNLLLNYRYLKHIFFSLLFLVLVNYSFSQGTTCAGATSVTTNGSCTSSANITDATIDGNANVCTAAVVREAWYVFTSTGTTATIVATANNRNVAIELLSACGGAVIGCDNTTNANGTDTETLNATGLTNGTNYIVRIVNVGGNNDMTLTTLCITGPVTAPANDNCTGATVLTVNSSSICTTSSGGTVLGATTSTNANTCTGTADDDVWYSFTATSTSHSVSITNVAGSVTDMAHSVYAGTCGSLGTPLVCSDPNISTVSGLTVGNVYYVRVYTYTGTGGQNTTFSVCVLTPPPPPSNDDPSGATPIVAGAACSFTTFTNAGATASTCGTIPAPGCASYSGGDVWFSVTVPVSGSITFSTQTGAITDGGMAIYSGTPCGALTLISCSDDVVGSMPAIALTGQTAGATLYIRCWEFGNDNNGTFGLCAAAIIPPTNDNCSGAFVLSVNSNTLCASSTSATSTNASQSQAGCTGNADDDVWFSFVASATTQSITVTPGTMNNAVFEVFTGPCGSLISHSCINNTTGGTAESSSIAGLTIGTTYFVRVYSNANGGGTGTFSVCVNIPPPPPANDECTGAYVLTVNSGITCTSQTGGTLLNSSASAQTTTCAPTYDDDDVWYSFVATATTHSLAISNVAGNNTDLYHSVYSGSCGSISAAIICEDNNTSLLSGLTIGTTYFVRIYTYGTTVNANTTFSVCITTPVDPCSSVTNITACGTSVATTIPAGTGIYSGTSSCGYSVPGNEKIFTFTPATSGNFVIQQGSSFDYIDYQYKAVSAGCNNTGWTCIDDLDGAVTSTGAMALTAGVAYYILLDPESTTGGNVTFTVVCPPPAPNNDNCIGAYALTVNPGTTCTSQTGGTLYGATASAQTTTCNPTYDDDDVWYSFVATSTSHSLSISNVAGNNTDLFHSVYSGSCGSISAAIICEDANTSLISGLTAGTTYFVRIYTYGTTANANTTFSVCITTPVDPCASVTNIVSCGSSVSTNITAGSGLYSTSACGYSTPGSEKIFTFTPATTGNYVIQQGSSFAYIDYQYKAVSAGCTNTGWTCIDDLTGAATGAGALSLTAGVQYYILLDPETNAGGSVTFTIVCPPPPPANDNCTGAYPVTVNAGLTCTSLTGGTLYGATASTQTNTCGANADDDVWYSFVATNTSHSITVSNVAGNNTDLFHSVYAGSCGSVGPPLACSDPNTSGIFGLILGNTYYIRIFSYNTSFSTTTFSVCVTTPPPTGPCGNPTTNDYCSSPATLTQGVGTFSSSTSGIFTADQTSPLSSVFCGSIENNSWYYFVATTTSVSFPITSVSGCTSSYGIQAQVYAVTQTTLGCCSSFTSVSNCFNPATNTTGTVTATGLNIGQTYMLMVDGNSGNVCNYTISNWTAVGILPIELLTFVGKNDGEKNLIQWATASEKNTSYFRLERSRNGVDFENVIDVNASMNSQSPKYYSAFDMNPFEKTTYYRLKLVHLDGRSEYSNIISIDNSNLTNYVSNTRPNPTKGNVEFDVNTTSKGKIHIEVYDNTGKIVRAEEQFLEEGYQSLNLDLNTCDSGIYLLKVTFENSGETAIQKIIKN
ncbi:MAG: T9SS type A sorting domain-containing protein [Bacteroidota bacterium]